MTAALEVNALEVDALVRDYGSGARIGPLSFAARQGEFLSVLGPSGCGKTTLLRCIAGFEPVDEGRLVVGGVDLSATPAHKRQLGLVFQNYALFPHLTVKDNVAFGLRLRRVPRPEQEERVADALRIVGLEELWGRYPSQLSGGQQQRVAIARSLVLRPSIMLFDEPLSNLDYKLRLQMRDELLALQRRLGMTFVFVTHDQTEALALSDRIIVMSQGRIEQIGTAREVYRYPRTRFVADFIGGANLLPVAASTSTGPGRVRARLELGVELDALVGETPVAGRSWVAVRPESLSIAKPDEGETGLRGRVGTCIYAGDRVKVVVRLDGANGEATEVSLYTHPDTDLPETVALRVAPDGAVLVGETP